MKGQKGKKGKYIVRAKRGLLNNTTWRRTLKDYPTSLICLIRERLLKKISGLTEKFNSNSRYFGYWIRDDKDRVYIYVQKEQLVIDLCISSDFATTLNKQGFRVKTRDNFQGQKGWLTGWQVPQSTTDADRVVNWLCKAFKSNL